jgi:hypothetical protein
MLRIRDLRLPLSFTQDDLLKAAASRLKLPEAEIISLSLVKKSVDARKKDDVHFTISVDAEIKNEAKALEKLKKETTVKLAEPYRYDFPKAGRTPFRPVVVGAGPAGLFAAWILAKAGCAPLLLERGQDVDTRSKAVSEFWRTGRLDTECNAQFGEGGAGTFSDGKLATGTKDSRIELVLREFAACGAPEEILYLAKPHIGTDRLKTVIKNMREEIRSLGGEVLFGAKFTRFEERGGQIEAVHYEKDGETRAVSTRAVILAIGHSARDVFETLYSGGVAMAQKAFSAGLRIEHRREDIDRAMYGKFAAHSALSAADYSLAVHLPGGRGVYSFCMCPGGRVIAAASEEGGVVTNGMSLFARDEENSNSALLVSVTPEDFPSAHPLAGIEFQRRIERAAYAAGGGDYKAPAICAGDFLAGKPASGFGRVRPSYPIGVKPASPEEYLPDYIVGSLREALPLFGRKIKGFDAEDAVMTGAESRSSSPVRILRGENFCSLNFAGLYPCGEGAGYAGGITSAAVDGVKCAEALIHAYFE